ncbi:MAG TPA: hypothetical protein VHZ99_05060 [Steroidobacteraceae bacterium]|nr:hypothetical protein [Steroidobacteraceae bacterium]
MVRSDESVDAVNVASAAASTRIRVLDPLEDVLLPLDELLPLEELAPLEEEVAAA